MMTPHQFIAVTVRLFALWLALTSAQIGLLTYAMRSSTQHGGEVSYALAMIYLILAICLWKFPFVVARRLLPEAAGAAAGQLIGVDAVAVAFVVTGLLTIALKALTPVANYLSLLTMLVSSGQLLQLRTPSLHVDGVVGVVMLLIGGGLVMKCRALAERVLPGCHLEQ